MKNIEIFTTKDGSVGLFNKELNEIYQSREGAPKESKEKFIIPSDLEQRQKQHSCIRFLYV